MKNTYERNIYFYFVRLKLNILNTIIIIEIYYYLLITNSFSVNNKNDFSEKRKRLMLFNHRLSRIRSLQCKCILRGFANFRKFSLSWNRFQYMIHG